MSGRVRMESAVKETESKVKLPQFRYSVNHLPRVGFLSNTMQTIDDSASSNSLGIILKSKHDQKQFNDFQCPRI